MVEKISAVTLRVANMRASVRFYKDVLGLEIIYGGEGSYFTSLRTRDGDVILNLEHGDASPKISEKLTRSASASRGPRFRDLCRRFLLPNRTVLRHKWFECGLWPPASCQEADCGSMGTEFASC